MAKKERVRMKDIIGVRCTSADGNVWTWNLGGRFFRWCKLGHCEMVNAATVTRVMYSKKLEGAVGYTAGWTDGFVAANRNVQGPMEIGGDVETKSAETSPSQHGG